MLCSGGLKLPKSSVKTANARSIGASTTIDVRIDVSLLAGCSWVLLRVFLDGHLVGRERFAPELVELGAERAETDGVDA